MDTYEVTLKHGTWYFARLSPMPVGPPARMILCTAASLEEVLRSAVPFVGEEISLPVRLGP